MLKSAGMISDGGKGYFEGGPYLKVMSRGRRRLQAGMLERRVNFRG